MKRFQYIFFAILALFAFKLNAQCDYYNSVTVSTSGYHAAAGYVQEYVFVDDLTGVVMEINTTGIFTPANSGIYRIYAVNYPTPAPAQLSVGSLWTGIASYAASNCMDIIGPYTGAAVSICEEICELDDIVVSSSGYHTAAGFQQIYVLVNDAGNIIDSNTTGTFTGLMAGVYFVYAVNTEESDVINEINNLGAWADIPAMSSTYCLDIIGPQAFDLIPAITPLFDPVGPYCEGDAIPALPTTSTNGILGSWSPAIDNTNTTLYTFTPDAGQCALDNDLTITVNPIPTAGITNNTGTDVIDCTVTQIDVTATGGGTYDWGGGVTTAANSLTAAGTYTLTVTDLGCTATESITITEDIVPPTAGITNNTGSTVIDCITTQIDVTATGGGAYDWGGGVTTAANSFTSAGTYTLTVTDLGCTATESITITEDITPPTAGITNNTGTTVINCNTTQVDVTATGGGTYDWGGGVTTAANSFMASGTYTVTVTGANGCTATESITITEDIAPPTAGITNNTGSTVIDCITTQIDATATGGGTYDWGGGVTTAANSFTTAGTYTVTVTGAKGCTSTESISKT
nr:hypothetical protein [Bacteroidales bacterium]